MVLYVDVVIDVGERRGENEFAIGTSDALIVRYLGHRARLPKPPTGGPFMTGLNKMYPESDRSTETLMRP